MLVKRKVAVKSYAKNFNTAGYRDDRAGSVDCSNRRKVDKALF